MYFLAFWCFGCLRASKSRDGSGAGLRLPRMLQATCRRRHQAAGPEGARKSYPRLRARRQIAVHPSSLAQINYRRCDLGTLLD